VKKSSTYRQTFRRHRLLLSVPIVLAVLIAGGLTVMSPKSYMSTASLWVDNPATTDSSLGNLNPAMTPPSTQEQNVVTELLATEGFDLKVAHNSSLASYLSSHSGGGIPLLGGGGGTLKDRIVAALAPPAVSTTVPGPQVLQISFTGPTPQVARSTLRALVTQLQKDSSSFSQTHSQAAIQYYLGQVDTATQALQATRNQADAYRAQHPNAQPGDPNLAAFQAAETSAGSDLAQAQAGLSASKAAVKGGSTASQVQVIDSADLPTAPTSGKKKQVEGILAGLAAGLLISFLGTLGLTKRESDPWEDELAEAAGSGPLAQPGGLSPHARGIGNRPYPIPAPAPTGNGSGEVPTQSGGQRTFVTSSGSPMTIRAAASE
jgi:uncharacterized protein involved in exopolysaccharide biosynthesis